jgi:hypothetical protein
MTRASQLALQAGARRLSPAGRKRRKAKASAKRAKRVTRQRRKGKAAKFVKGSAAAKRYMAKLRRMRKR